MRQLLISKETFVWLMLLALAALSWLFGFELSVIGNDFFVPPVILILVFAFIKARLVIIHFMEIDTAPMALRILFECWTVLVCMAVIAFYLLS